MPSIFTKIIQRELPAHIIAENERFIAFLDIFPLQKGHCIVIPKQEIDYLFDLNNDLLAEILCFSKPIAKAIEKVVPCKRIGVSVIGLEVPHAHIHLIPINAVSDMDFSKERLSISTEEFGKIAESIRANL